MHPSFPGSIRLFQGPSAAARWQRHGRQMLFAAAAVGMLSIGQAVAEEADEPAPARASETVTPGKNGKVCKLEDVTGSRMRKRVCHTPENWEAREKAAKELVRELDARPVGDQGGG